ncbi:D-alanyl-D-alanine carboxypeptidase [Secundilactobacillus yichangensis]|uniref:D-alanyl-D-alanine carboxypeptidase n=1 Tax=Secundilactobacillus yichangensis TaxID=2799580 RepID=UPI00194083A8|nr:D-alanyl-D-alanine carboxypeptidase [Secundilactobacillus yichangensis]
MKKPFLIIALFAGLFTAFSVTTPASAKTKSAKVLSSRTLSKKPYHAVSGYLYTSTSLTKKAHNADNYPFTVFYTYKSDTVRKANGNKAVYYYVRNGNGKVKGWIWRGHLVRVVDTQKQLSQLNELVNLIDSTTTKTHNQIVALLKNVNNNTSLSTLINNLTDLQNSLTNNSDIAKLGQIISLIRSDVSTGINNLYNTAQILHNVNTNLTSLINGLLNQISTK